MSMTILEIKGIILFLPIIPGLTLLQLNPLQFNLKKKFFKFVYLEKERGRAHTSWKRQRKAERRNPNQAWPTLQTAQRGMRGSPLTLGTVWGRGAAGPGPRGSPGDPPPAAQTARGGPHSPPGTQSEVCELQPTQPQAPNPTSGQPTTRKCAVPL